MARQTEMTGPGRFPSKRRARSTYPLSPRTTCFQLSENGERPVPTFDALQARAEAMSKPSNTLYRI